jgi:hypothetical protein
MEVLPTTGSVNMQTVTVPRELLEALRKEVDTTATSVFDSCTIDGRFPGTDDGEDDREWHERLSAMVRQCDDALNA